MRVLDLFSGIGGFSLAADWLGWETVAFCEREPFPRKVLAKHWPDVPIHDDVRKIEEFEQYAGTVELICGGYPCQPFSVAGKQRGTEDDRHLWPAMFEIIKAVRPRWVVAENVAGHVRMGLDSVLSDLESEKYTAQALIIPACAVNAKHRRDRVWIVGHADNEKHPISAEQGRRQKPLRQNDSDAQGGGQQRDNKQASRHESIGARLFSKPVRVYQSSAYADDKRREKHDVSEITTKQRCDNRHFCERSKNTWSGVEPGICRSLDGISPGVDRSIKIPNRNARIKALGNAIVPQVAYQIFKAIEQAEVNHV